MTNDFGLSTEFETESPKQLFLYVLAANFPECYGD